MAASTVCIQKIQVIHSSILMKCIKMTGFCRLLFVAMEAHHHGNNGFSAILATNPALPPLQFGGGGKELPEK